MDVSDLEGGAVNGAFACRSGVDQATDQAEHGHPVTLVNLSVLQAREDAGTEADEGEPDGVAGREGEFAEGLLAAGGSGRPTGRSSQPRLTHLGASAQLDSRASVRASASVRT